MGRSRYKMGFLAHPIFGAYLAITNHLVPECYTHFLGTHLAITKPFGAWMRTPWCTQTVPECEHQGVP